MPYKTKICFECLASFVPETKNQELCKECLLFEQREGKPHKRPEPSKYKPVYKKNYKKK